MLGDGIEDYEYFAMLSRRLAAATPQQKALYEPLLSVPTTVTKSLTDFTTDPAPLEAHRVKLARALEEKWLGRGIRSAAPAAETWARGVEASKCICYNN